MTDITSSTPQRHRCGRRRGAEFHLYFALIFIAAIPFAAVTWVRDAFRNRSLNMHGPLARAWAEADRITPLIFSA